MMAYVAKQVADIADMPRGGPDASCLDRLLQTSRPEYLDRDDVADEVKRGIVGTLDRVGTLFREHDRNAALVLRRGRRRGRSQDPGAGRRARRAVADRARPAPDRPCHGLRRQPGLGGRDRGLRPGPASPRHGAHHRRDGHRRRRRLLRPGGVRAVLPPPAARAGGAGPRRRHPGGRPAAGDRSAAPAVAAAPCQAGDRSPRSCCGGRSPTTGSSARCGPTARPRCGRWPPMPTSTSRSAPARSTGRWCWLAGSGDLAICLRGRH